MAATPDHRDELLAREVPSRVIPLCLINQGPSLLRAAAQVMARKFLQQQDWLSKFDNAISYIPRGDEVTAITSLHRRRSSAFCKLHFAMAQRAFIFILTYLFVVVAPTHRLQAVHNL